MTNQTIITTIDFDMAWDYYDTPDFWEPLNRNECTHTLLALEGPGGGNPNLVVHGTLENITNLLTEWGYYPEDIKYYTTGEW